jgi:hypothetical protein
LVNLSIGMYSDSTPLPESCSGPEPTDVQSVEGVVVFGVIGSPPEKPEVAGGSPPSPGVPIPANSYPQLELAFGSDPSALQSLPEITLGL